MSLDGVATDSASVELDDAAAFLMFIALKRTLTDGAPAKRKGRRGASVTNDETGGTDAASETEDV
ncbi:MAG TPA: hypothetical protein P5164_06575 [Thermoanaerobaculia bacterium]|nr:hypothetical protein [Thermoanaerobaculia bacterium]